MLTLPALARPVPNADGPPKLFSEENYYFKLFCLQDQLLAYFQQNPEFIRPETRRNEVIAFVKSGLRDLSSAAARSSGASLCRAIRACDVRMAGCAGNYCTAIGLGSEDPAEQKKFEHYWPADVHMIGKEIIRFHCVYWPAS